MEKGTRVEMEPSTIFTTTPAKYVSLIRDIMKVTTEEKLENLKAPRIGQKKKISHFALLTSALHVTNSSTRGFRRGNQGRSNDLTSHK